MAAGSIVVDLLMKTGSFETDTKRAQRQLKTLEKTVDDVAKKLAVGFTVASGAVSAMVLKTTQAAEEIKRFSDLAGASGTEFQKMAAGASTVGISQEKLADQFKDFREKFGEYLDTGGGGMKDFFENIAPKIGVTADQFRKLSGPQALQLYVSSLEKANLSQEQMSFYLESMASDTTALLPLLRDNGKALKEIADQAEATGQIMSDDLIKNSIEFQRQMDQLTGILRGFANAITQQILPSLIRMSDEFLLGMQNANGLFDAISKFGTINPFRSESENLKVYRNELEKLYEFRDAQVKRGGIFGSTAAVDKDIADVEAKIKYLEALQQRSFERNPTAGAGSGLVNPSPVTAQAATSFGPTAAQKKASEAAAKTELSERKKYDEEMRALNDAANQYQLDMQQKRLDEQLEKDRAYQEMLTEFETAESENRQQIYSNRLLAQEEADKGYWGRWLEAAQESMLSFNELASSVINNFATGFGNAFEQIIFDSKSLSDAVKGLTESMARSVVNALGQMAAQWVAQEAVKRVASMATTSTVVAGTAAQTAAGVASNAVAATSAVATGATITAAMAPAAVATSVATGGISTGTAIAAILAAMALIPMFAGSRERGGDVIGGRSYLVGENGPEMFTPRGTGTITPNGGGGGGIVQNINISTGVAQTVRAEIMSLMPQIINAAKSAVADARMRGGSYGRSMG
jgi:hypothetical protein